MSDSGNEGQAHRLEQERIRLQRRMAELAASIADTEEQVAGTFEVIAERRSGPDAERLRAGSRMAMRRRWRQLCLSSLPCRPRSIS
jgi:hypothetical protein